MLIVPKPNHIYEMKMTDCQPMQVMTLLCVYICWWSLVSTKDKTLILKFIRLDGHWAGQADGGVLPAFIRCHSNTFWVTTAFQSFSFFSAYKGLYCMCSAECAPQAAHYFSICLPGHPSWSGSFPRSNWSLSLPQSEAAVRKPPRPKTLNHFHAKKPVKQQRTCWRSTLRVDAVLLWNNAPWITVLQLSRYPR